MRLIALHLVLRLLHLQKRCRAHAQLGFVDRLGDEVVRAGFDRVQPMLPRLERRHHDDGHVAPGRILADAPAHVEAVEPRHDDVEEHEIDAELKLGEPFDAVARRLDFVPQPFDEQLRDFANAFVIVDDEHALAGDRGREGFRAIVPKTASRRRASDATSQPTSALRMASMPGLDLHHDRRDLIERAVPARVFTSSAHDARDRIGADDRDAALQRVRRAKQGFAIAARGGFADRLHLTGALAHERVDELRDEPARPARLEAAQVPRHFAGRI